MTEDQINKVETLIGYLEYFLKRYGSHGEIENVVEEANEWIAEEKSNSHQDTRKIK